VVRSGDGERRLCGGAVRCVRINLWRYRRSIQKRCLGREQNVKLDGAIELTD